MQLSGVIHLHPWSSNNKQHSSVPNVKARATAVPTAFIGGQAPPVLSRDPQQAASPSHHQLLDAWRRLPRFNYGVSASSIEPEVLEALRVSSTAELRVRV